MTFRNLLALIIAIGLRRTLAVVRRYLVLQQTQSYGQGTELLWHFALIDCGHW